MHTVSGTPDRTRFLIAVPRRPWKSLPCSPASLQAFAHAFLKPLIGWLSLRHQPLSLLQKGQDAKDRRHPMLHGQTPLSVPSTSQWLAALQPFCVNPKSLPDKANGSLRPDFQKTPPTDTQLGSKRAPNRSLPGQGVHQIAFEPPIRRSTPHLVPNKTPHTNPIYFVHAPSCPKRLSSSSFYPSSPLTKPPTSDPEPVIHHMPSH